MDRTIQSAVDAETTAVQQVLCDLTTYEHWLELVDSVEEAEPADGDPGPAYWVTLVGKIGPFARRKRLRMVRVDRESTGAMFERREIDGRDHSPWVLGAHAEAADPTVVSMRLAYGGGLWSEVLEAVLDGQVARAGDGLGRYARRISDGS